MKSTFVDFTLLTFSRAKPRDLVLHLLSHLQSKNEILRRFFTFFIKRNISGAAPQDDVKGVVKPNKPEGS
jgi:hypothetical protein